MEEEETNDTIESKETIHWIENVNVYIVPIAAGILIMLLGIYLMLNIQHFTNDCNDHWQKEMKACGCLGEPRLMPAPNLTLDYAFEKNPLDGTT